MRRVMRGRFWIESGIGLASGLLLVVTAIMPTWIETVFGMDPDRYNGSFERVFVLAVLVIAMSSAALARHEWTVSLATHRS
jgi:hypothetical protein